MKEKRLPSAGQPVLPVKYVPHAALAAVVMLAVGNELMDPAPWSLPRVGRLVISVTVGAMGILSPGWRRS